MQEKEILERASQEIKSLRSQNTLMSARLDMFDNLMRLFHTVPNYGGGGLMSPDIIWEIDKHLESLKTEKNGTN